MANSISVSVLADVRDIQSKLGSIDSRLGKTGSAFKKVGGLIAGAFAGGAAINGVKAMVTSASDLNETISKTEAIFGKSSPAIKAWADGAAKSMGLSKQSALDGATTFGNFFNQIGIGAQKTEAMSKSFVKASVDLGSFHNAAPVEVMDALAAATRGEYDSLQKFIPTINAATVEQKAMAMTGKKLASELTNQDKALATHAIVMKGQGKAAGDFARTQDSLANQTKIAKAQFDNMVASLGQKLLPIAVKVATFANTTLVPALMKMGNYVQTKVIPAFKQFGTFLQENSDYLIALGAGLVAAKVALVAYNAYVKVTTVVTKAWAVAQKILNGTMKANPVGIVITALALLAGALVLAYKKSETFRKIVDKAWAGIKAATQKAFPVIKNVIVTVFKAIWTFVKGAVKVITVVVKTAWTVIKTVTKVAWSLFKTLVINPVKAVASFVKNAVGTIKGAVTNAWATVKSKTSAAWNAFKNIISNAINNAMQKVTAIKSKVTGAFSGAASWLYEAGKNIVQGIVNGLNAAKGWISDKISELTAMIPGKFKSLLGIASPSKVMTRLGKEVGRGVEKGIKSRIPHTAKAAENMAKAVVKKMNATRSRLANLKGAAKDLANSVGDSFASFASITQQDTDAQLTSGSIIEDLQRKLEKAKAFATYIKELTKAGLNKDTLKELLAAGPEAGFATAQAMAVGGKESVKEINRLSAAIKTTGKTLGKDSAKAMYRAGIHTAQGLVNGLKKKENAILRAAKNMGKKVLATVRKIFGIKSPSKEFAKIGNYIGQGLAKGLDGTAAIVRAASSDMALNVEKGFTAPELALNAKGGTGATSVNITVNVPATANPAETGRAVASALDAYYKQGGRRLSV